VRYADVSRVCVSRSSKFIVCARCVCLRHVHDISVRDMSMCASRVHVSCTCGRVRVCDWCRISVYRV